MLKSSMGACALALCFVLPAYAQEEEKSVDIETGGKLRLTRGISTIEGQGGGGLTPWALITGDETDRGIGGTHRMKQVAGNTNLTEIGKRLPGLKEKGLSPYQGLLHAIEFGLPQQAADFQHTGPVVFPSERRGHAGH